MREGGRERHLSPNLENIFKAQTGRNELVLQQHDNIIVVFVDLVITLPRLGLFRFRIGLEGGYLLVQVRNILFDDVGEFLRGSWIGICYF